MKDRQLKIRIILLSALVGIMSILIIFYSIFCLDGDYNQAKIKEKTTEVQTEAPATPENTPEITLPANPDNSQNVTNGISSFPAIDPETYNPVENLATENWAVTLVNKNFGLGKNFYPENVVQLEGYDIYLDSRVAQQYNLMYQAAFAEEEKIVLIPSSGYQNYQTQKRIYDDKVKSLITTEITEEEAIAKVEMRINPAGFSENGAGLAIDFAPASTDFASSKEFNWLMLNAHKYGFVLRYPEDKTEITGMLYQPWHWRYVGVEAATEMKEKNLCLEEYLGVK